MIKYKRFARVNLLLMLVSLSANLMIEADTRARQSELIEYIAPQRGSTSMAPQQFEAGKNFESAALQAEAKPETKEPVAAPVAPAPTPPAAAPEPKPATVGNNKAATNTDTKQQDSATKSPMKTFTFNKQSSFWSKSGTVSKSKLPTKISSAISTGSSVATHYISTKQAMADRFGAFVQDAVRKLDKRNLHPTLVAKPLFANGNQTVIGVGEMLNRLKGVTDNGLARSK